MDLSTYEGRAARIAELEGQVKELDASHQKFIRQQKERESEISAVCTKVANAINEPLYQLIRDIRAMR